MDEQNLEAIMGLIMYGGNAKSDAMEAIAAAKEGDFELADQKSKMLKHLLWKRIIRKQDC